MSNDSGMTMEWLAPVVTGVIGLAGIAGTYKAAAAQRKFQIDAIRLQQQYDWAKIEVAKREAAYLEYMVALKGTVVAIMGRAKAKGHYKFTDPLDKQTCEKMLIAARRPREEAWERLRAQVDRPVVDAA